MLSLLLISVMLLTALPACQKKANGRSSNGNKEMVTLLLLSEIQAPAYAGGELITIFSCSYDRQGNAIEIKVNADDEGSITYKYSANNSVDMHLISGASDYVASYTFTFRNDGKPIEAVSYDDKGAVSAKEVYSYDDHGNITAETMYKNGELYYSVTYTYEYDNNGNVLSETSSDWGTTIYTYDEDGTLLEINSGTTRIVFEYDGKGNLIKRSNYSLDGKLIEQVLFTYDSQGCTKTGPYAEEGEFRYIAVTVTRTQAEKLINQYAALHEKLFFNRDYALIMK